jgi:TolA-binding protein
LKTVAIILMLLLTMTCLTASADELQEAWNLLAKGERGKAKELAAVALAGGRNTKERGEAFLILALCEKNGQRTAGHVEQFLSDFPGHALTWRAETHMGLYYYALGTYGRAGSHFRRASEVKASGREQTQSRYWLGLSLLGAGDPAKAKQHFESVRKDDAGTGLADEAALGFADCLREEGKYSAALSEYRRITSKYRSSDWLSCALYGTGVCLEKLQKKSEALEVYSELARKFPASFEAAIVRERVADTREAEAASTDSRGFAVQLGAFSEEANAHGLIARLREKGVTDVRIVQKERGGRILYVVYFGEFSTREAAEEEAKELSTRFGLSYGIVSR